MSQSEQSQPVEFATVEQFLTFIGRAKVREHGISSGQMGNWAHAEPRLIPPRHIPLFTTLCAERGVDLPLHLFNVARQPERADREDAAATR